MIDLKTVGQFLHENDLMHKPIAEFNKWEIDKFCETIVEAADPESGFSPPFIRDDCLYIPANAPKKYRWWQGGQSIKETLAELGVGAEIKKKYSEKWNHGN